MPAYSDSSTLPREELALAVVEGENSIDSLIGSRVMDDLPLTWRNAHMVKVLLADSLALRSIDANKYIHAPGTKFERLTAKFSDISVTVTPRGVELVIPWEMMLDYQKRIDVLSFFASKFGKEISGFTKEVLTAGVLFNTANSGPSGAATNSTVAYTAALNSTCSYIGDSIAATRRLKALGEAPPYKQVIAGPVYERVRQSATVQAYVRGSLVGTTDVTLSAITAALKEFGIDEVIVADSYQNTGADGDVSLVQIWSNSYFATFKKGTVGGASKTGGVGTPTIGGIGAMAYWEGYDNLGAPSDGMPDGETTFEMVGGNYVETYPERSIKSEVMRINMSYKPYVLNVRALDLVATQYS